MTEILSKEILKDINEFIEFQIKDKSIPCISVSVVARDDSSKKKECHNLFKKIFHHKDIKTPIPTLDKTLFRVASVSKLFTYVAILQLVDKGLLSLEDPVTKYIPDFHPKNPQSTTYSNKKEFEPDLYKKITVFNLIRHTSGLIREPIEGNYFNEIQSDLITLVKTMNESSLVSEPWTEHKYSNAAVAIAGYIVEVVSGETFPDYVEKNILKPLGMLNSTFKNEYAYTEVKDENQLRTATGHMWRYWDETTTDLSVYKEAPLTYFGMFPAAGLATTVDDISKFLQFFLQDGKPLLKYDTFVQFLTQQPLKAPIKPENIDTLEFPYVYNESAVAQTPTSTGTSSYGLGVEITNFFGYQIARHGGAVNGFATDFRVLPELGLGIFTCSTLDVCNAVSQQISEYITCQLASSFVKETHSLVSLNKVSLNKTLESIENRKQFLNSTLLATEIPDSLYDNISGYWYLPTSEQQQEEETFNDNDYVQIMKSYNGMVYSKDVVLSKLALLPIDKKTGEQLIITADRMSCGQVMLKIPKDFNFNDKEEAKKLKLKDKYTRDSEEAQHSLIYCKYKPLPLKSEITIQPPLTEEFKDLIGFYSARDHMAIIFEENGHLNFNIEWLFNYKMKFLSAVQQGDTSIVHFLLSPTAMYNNEIISFHMKNGVPLFLSLSGIKFKFQSMSTQQQQQQPGVYPKDICSKALAESFNTPFPFEDENARINHNLVDLSSISPTLKFDIKYATTDNFTGIQLYKQAKAFLNKDAAKCLLSAHNWLVENWNVGIIVFDSYRPWNITWTMAESVIPEFRGLYVAPPTKGSVHNRGGALDISLYDLSNGKVIEMVGDFDEFSIRSHRSYFGGSELQRWYRKLLTIALINNNFRPNEHEWWHFDIIVDKPLAVLNLQFDQIN
ncbi:beta-lactamase family protein [Dictyostelium discoideum AX4]|uniref:Beta-lactamase family protein n=1 Tax=Dictyostelium discoideum TaxID=44689 RepID=C7G020_DICDI|nr:beta-lactamase family protein [Dictyostelium discoideum AX4]EEU04100.1 beta-lactamase family protein [Dictyostelium discoideum AX4]|eukprot:XP_002649152.1 beta-lactamase family protein [Dictyostelium discoideum AX4]